MTESDPKRTSGRHPNKPFQSGIVSLSAAGQISEQALREAVPINVLQRLEGPSNEVIIDKIYAAATGYARDYIVKRKTGIWGPTEKQEARSYYTNHNSILIR